METTAVNSHATPLPEYLNPQVIMAWKAPLRPYKKRAKHVLRFYLAVALLLSGIIFFFGDKILLVPIWALLFLFYVLTITPPPIVENKISQFGVDTAGVTMRWEVLSHFYFTQRFGYDVLTLVTIPPYSLYAYMVVPTAEIKEQVLHVLAAHILYQEHPQRTFSDRAIDWMMHLIPDDDEPETAENATKNLSTDAKVDLKPEHTEEITSFWENVKHQMDFMHHEKSAVEVPSSNKQTDSKEKSIKSEDQIKETLKSKLENEVKIEPKESREKMSDTIKSEQKDSGINNESNKQIPVTSLTSSASSGPTPMPESLLRHISEPSEANPRQS